MPANVLAMAKVIVIGLALKGYVAALPEVFLPMLPQLDALDPQLFRRALQVAFWIAAPLLLMNLRVRTCSPAKFKNNVPRCSS